MTFFCSFYALSIFAVFHSTDLLKEANMPGAVSSPKTVGKNIPGNGGNGKINKNIFLPAVEETIKVFSKKGTIFLVNFSSGEKTIIAINGVQELIGNNSDGIVIIPKNRQEDPEFSSDTCRFAIQPDGRITFCETKKYL